VVTASGTAAPQRYWFYWKGDHVVASVYTGDL
jgi:hypothetical protein